MPALDTTIPTPLDALYRARFRFSAFAVTEIVAVSVAAGLLLALSQASS